MTKLVLSNKRQLIDINEDATLFDIDVTVTADPSLEFKAAVVNQTQLDAGDITYKRTIRSKRLARFCRKSNS